MIRSQLSPLPEYFDRYILLCDDVTIDEAIETSIREIENAPMEKWKALGDKVYEPGKWTIKEMLQHLTDTERIFTYRALAFARGETQQPPSFDEDGYARASKANRRSLNEIVEELLLSHQSFRQLYRSFDEEMLLRTSMGFKGPYTVGALGYIMPGHQRWHFKILEERYFPLLR